MAGRWAAAGPGSCDFVPLGNGVFGRARRPGPTARPPAPLGHVGLSAAVRDRLGALTGGAGGGRVFGAAQETDGAPRRRTGAAHMNLLTQSVCVSHYLVVGAIMFVTGAVCMATKRNALGVL